jgi:small subunit ribosomal protein S20
MPITKSAVKRARQNPIRHARLVPYKTQMKTMIKKLTQLVKDGKKDEAIKLLPMVYKSIDTAAKKRLLHRNTADRKKASMARLLK